MRYLLFSDVHCDRDACEQIVEKSAGADFAIGAGDFALLRKGLRRTIDLLSGISIPTVLVPGNHETYAELLLACEGIANFHVLHGSEIRLGGVSFIGIGGGIPMTPFGAWTVDYSEDTAEKLLPRPDGEFVFVTHSPPFGCLDALSNQQHVGSTTIRSFVERELPMFAVCGHIHEQSRQQREIAGVPVINAGPMVFEFEFPVRPTARS